jgi:hypothetical protein
MTTLVNDPSTPLSRLNFFDDPTPWNQVRVAGILVLAVAVKFNGIKVEDKWKMQKSKSASGAVFSFNGTDPVGGESGFSIAFRITSRDEFDQLYDIYDALKPVPVLGGGGGTGSTASKGSQFSNAAGSPPKPDDATAESLLAQAQAAMKALNSPTPAASSADPAAQQAAATAAQPNPGPRPPTVPIELGWLAFLGVFAVARQSWEFSSLEEDNIEVTIGFVQDKPPTPAGVGAMAAPKPAPAQFVDVAANSKTAANAGAAGT